MSNLQNKSLSHTESEKETNYLDPGKFLPLNLEILYTKIKLALSFNTYILKCDMKQ